MKKLTCLITLFLFISVGYINAETMASRKKIKMKVETQHHQRSLPPPCPAEAFICGNTVDLIFRETNKTAVVTIMNLDTGEAIHYNVSTNDCSISIDLGNNQSESNYNIELILDGKSEILFLNNNKLFLSKSINLFIHENHIQIIFTIFNNSTFIM